MIHLSWRSQVTRTAVDSNGSVLQDAVIEGKTDFVRLLLEHGCKLSTPIFSLQSMPLQRRRESYHEQGGEVADWNRSKQRFHGNRGSALRVDWQRAAASCENANNGGSYEQRRLRGIQQDSRKSLTRVGGLSKIIIFVDFCFVQVSSTAVNNGYGSLMRNAVLDHKTFFVQLLLQHG